VALIAFELRLAQISTKEICPGKLSAGEIRLSQVSINEDRAF